MRNGQKSASGRRLLPAATRATQVMILLGLTLLTGMQARAAEASAQAQVVAPPVKARDASAPPQADASKAAPVDGMSEIRASQRLNEISRKSDALEMDIGQYGNFITSLQEAQARLAAIKPDEMAPLLGQVDEAMKRRDENAARQALVALSQAFFQPVYTVQQQVLQIDATGFAVRHLMSQLNGDFAAVVSGTTQRTVWRTGLQSGLYAGFGEQRMLPISKAEREKLGQVLSDDSRRTFISALANALKTALDRAVSEKAAAEKSLSDLGVEQNKISEQLAKGRTEINSLAIKLGLPLFCGTIFLLFGLTSGMALFRRAGPEGDGGHEASASMNFGTLVEISTVLLLTMSILILGLAGKLDGPVLGTLLGGISGYVLNRTRDPKPVAPADKRGGAAAAA